MKQKIYNTGFNHEKELQDQSSEDWKLGAEPAKPLFYIPHGEIEQYLPDGELQNIGEEKMDCVTRAFLNRLEAWFNYAVASGRLSPKNVSWLKEKGYLNAKGKVEFSDAYIAIKSGTTRSGNSLKAPADAISNYGLVPKSLLPQVSSFDDYHNPARITREIESLATEFTGRFSINYSRGNETEFGAILEKEELIVGGFAWPVPFQGEYPRVNMPPNHAFLLYRPPKFTAFDNYEEAPNDFTKKLAPDYDFVDIGYRIFVTEERVLELTVTQKKSIWSLIVSFFIGQPKEDLEKLRPDLDPDFIPNLPIMTPNLPKEKLKEVCLASIGKDLSVLAPNELGCADSLSTVLKGVFPDFPRFLSTIALKSHLGLDKRFVRCEANEAWTVIVSPTVGKNIGHTGVMGENGVIYSNNSKTGLWSSHWTLDTWIAYYCTKKGLKRYFYKLL